jgi:hypothetical protein
MKRTLIVLIATLPLTALVTAAPAQDTVLIYEGRVVVVSMQSMVVALDNAPAVTFDLARIPQREVMDIAQNDYVVVTGVIQRPGRQVLAISVRRISPWFPQQSP